MVREAAARLYDVDRNTVVVTRLTETGKYDTGTIALRAKPGKLIDLDQLLESIWATRLSGGTKSGLVSIEVTAVGNVAILGEDMVINVSGSDSHFVIRRHSDPKHQRAFDELREASARGEKVVRVSGQLDGWSGRWPDLLRKIPAKPWRILVNASETSK
jgi:hypothetical protein